MAVDAHPEVVVVGGACLDIKGRLQDDGVMGTSNPGRVQISFGGVARNIAENLSRLQMPTALLAAICADDFGRAIVEHTAAAGVITDHILVSCEARSAAYLALLNQHGQMVIGLDDNAAAEALGPSYIRRHAALLAGARMVAVDANLPVESALALLEICDAAGVPVVLEPVSYRLAARYRELVGRFALTTPNAVEAEALTGVPVHGDEDALEACQALQRAGVALAVVTLGQNGLIYASAETRGRIPSMVRDIADATGGGDALAAATIYALLNDIPVDEALRLGASAAALTLASPETVCPTMSLESLYAQMIV